MQLAENEKACGNRTRQLVEKCLSDIRERVCDEVLATLSQHPPRLQNPWKSYAIVRSARQVCTKLLRFQYEGKTPKMGSAVRNVSPRRHSILEGDTGPSNPYSSVNGSLAAKDSLFVRETRPRAVIKLFGDSVCEKLAVDANEGAEPRMWPAAEVAVTAQRDGGQEGATDPYVPSSSENERSNLAVDARTSGEVHLFQGRESVDGLTAPPSAQKTGNVQELLCPEQTRSLEPLASTDESTSQVHILRETSDLNCENGPSAVTESDTVEDSSKFISNESETTTPVVSHAVTKTGVYSNSDLDSSIIITVDKSETQGALYPVTSSVTGHPVASLSACGMPLEDNADTNVATPVAGTEPGVWTGPWASSSYENSDMNVCGDLLCK